MATGQAGGVALAAAAEAGCEVAQYTANEVKQAVVGYGAATKDQVQRMVAPVLGLDEPPRPPDVADALALAACHLTTEPLRRAVAAAAAADGADRDRVAAGHAARPAAPPARSSSRSAASATGWPCRPRPWPASAPVGQRGLPPRPHPRARGRHRALRLRPRRRAPVLRGPPRCARRRARRWPSPSCRRCRRPPCRPRCSRTTWTRCASVPGVGKKTAARLLLELKARLDLPTLDGGPARAAPAPVDAARRGAGRAGRARLRPRRDRRGARGRRRRRARSRSWCGRPCASWRATGDARRPHGGPGGRRGRRRGRTRAARRPVDPVARAGRGGRRGRAAAPHPRRVRRPGPAHRAPPDRHRGGRASATSPPTTCSSPARPVWARRRWPASWPPRWAWACGSPPGPVLVRAGDLAALLTDLQEGDVLFIDEIHRMHRAVEEILYPAMEDFQLDILIGKGPTARSIRLDLPRFTLVGATTRTGSGGRSAARPLRLRGPARPLRRRRARGHRASGRPGSSGVPIDPDGARRDRRALPRARPASPTGCCAGCATSSRCGPRGRSRRRRPWPGSTCSVSTSSASTRSTGPSSTCCARASRAGRSASPRWPSASARSPTPSRTPTSRTCSSRACSSARARGRVAGPRAWAHLGLVPAEATLL